MVNFLVFDTIWCPVGESVAGSFLQGYVLLSKQHLLILGQL